MNEPTPTSLELTSFFEKCLTHPRWPEEVEAPAATQAWQVVAKIHRTNGLIWAEEDLARRRLATAEAIAGNKRAIDALNQVRNDSVERCDEILSAALASFMREGARLHSETPGQMIDRLSILSLKISAMGRQARRADADDSHRERCRAKVLTLAEQRDDLAGCLEALIADCREGRARFKVYRQFKMYNDPALNPSLYGEK